MARKDPFPQKGDRVIINDGMSSTKDGPFFVVKERLAHKLVLKPVGGTRVFTVDLHGASQV